MMRSILNVLATFAALVLLGLLVWLSTAVDTSGQQALDHGLRSLGAASERMVRLADDATVRGADARADLADLEEHFDRTLSRTTALVDRVTFAEDGGGVPSREAFAWFNVVEGGGDALIDRTRYRAADNRMALAAERLVQGSAAVRGHLGRYLDVRQRLRQDARNFVRDLREAGSADLADRVFGATNQSLQRIQQGGRFELEQAAKAAERLRATADDLDGRDEARLRAIASTLDTLVEARGSLLDAREEVVGSGFPDALAAVREMITRDYLYRLTTQNDARVLLNIYTALLLAVLVYFGVGLQRSYRALNASHGELEARVAERTQDLETAYNDLKESQVQLVQAEKMSSLGQLVAGIVHEINTPLLYVLNNTNLLAENVLELGDEARRTEQLRTVLRDPEAGPQALKPLLREIRASGADAVEETVEEARELCRDNVEGLEQISELVQSLKDFSRLDRADEDEYDLHEGLEKTLLITRNVLKYGIEVERDLDPELPLIHCAPSRINQIFTNLITNAAQAMDGKGQLTLRTRALDGEVLVAVRDTGCGIREEDLEKIMDPFFTTKPVGEGTGLGLSIVRQIVDAHEGRIEVDSTVGEGTEIRIFLPVRRASADANDSHAIMAELEGYDPDATLRAEHLDEDLPGVVPGTEGTDTAPAMAREGDASEHGDDPRPPGVVSLASRRQVA